MMMLQPEIVSMGGQKYSFEDTEYTIEQLICKYFEDLQKKEKLEEKIEITNSELKELKADLKQATIKLAKIAQIITHPDLSE